MKEYLLIPLDEVGKFKQKINPYDELLNELINSLFNTSTTITLDGSVEEEAIERYSDHEHYEAPRVAFIAGTTFQQGKHEIEMVELLEFVRKNYEATDTVKWWDGFEEFTTQELLTLFRNRKK
jgi:hypothetical protein